MKRLQNILITFWLCMALATCAQTKAEPPKAPEIKVLAKFIAFEGGNALHSAKFKVVKCLNEGIQLNDTISVGNYNYLRPDPNIETVLLILNRYNKQPTGINDSLRCIDHNGKTGIQKAKIEFIKSDFWEACETGMGDCKTLHFARQKAEVNWFLIMPCGGTETTISISGENFSKKMHLYHNNCPLYLDLSSLKDGIYYANMSACGLGGTVTFNLKTTP